MNKAQQVKTRDRLKELFPGKQVNRMISFRRLPRKTPVTASPPTPPSCPLSYTERLVYSFLLFRCRRRGVNIPASISRLARLSNLHRTTVKRALEGLEAYRIVKQVPLGWQLEVSERGCRLRNHEWYGFREKGCTIGDLGYHYFVQPEKGSGVNLIESLVMVADLLGPKKSSACLAARFGVHKKTIQRARARGRATAKNLGLFKDVQFKQRPKKPTTKQDFVASLKDATERRLAIEMIHCRVPLTQEEVRSFLEEARQRVPDDILRMYLFIKILGDDPNADKKQTMRGVLDEHRKGSWLALLRYRLGWGPRP